MDVHVIALPLRLLACFVLCALCFVLWFDSERKMARKEGINITILVLVRYLSFGLMATPNIPWAHSLRSYLIV